MQGLAKVDQRGLKIKLQGMARGGEAGADSAVRSLADAVVEVLEKDWPRDTNRSAGGWIAAANDAGLRRRPIPAVVESKAYQWLLARLEDQVEFYRRMLAKREETLRYWSLIYERRYTATGRKGKWERAAAAKKRSAEMKREKAVELLRRAEEELAELAAHPHSIVIWGKGLKKNTRAMDDLRFSRVARALSTIYGGRGQVVRVGGKSYVRLHNLEPHTSIVESREGVLRAALAAARGLGARRIGGVVRKAVREAGSGK